MRILSLFLVAAFLSVAAAPAEPDYPAFDGRWELDRAESDGISPVLEIFGMGRFKRGVADRVGYHQEIRIDDHTMVIEERGGVVYKRIDVVPLDGRPGSSEDFDGNPTVLRSRWTEDGRVLVTDWELTTRAGHVAPMRIRRSLEDGGDTTRVILSITDPDGEHIRMQRVYRRVD